ncbi:beta-lactamase [Xanthomonas bromi]|uniref:Beta-lactamase n=1 Tax=Xanthomonas bromi TaxID=56449 RepID=A0A1C3NQT3_9XANT|nr:DUF3471 domain-containing protein [Xanthomonas bromi]SBV52760.1 beta-lactamase [Xanthomonas bromi]
MPNLDPLNADVERNGRGSPKNTSTGTHTVPSPPWHGDIVIRQDRKWLRLQFSKTAQLVGTLEHWQHDSFIVRWDDRSLNADAFVNFALTPDGAGLEMRMEAISPLPDFSFDFQDLVLTPVPKEAPAQR